MVSNVINAIEMKNLDSSTFTGVYLPITTGVPKPVCLLRIINASNIPVTVSYDGVTAHDYVRAGTETTLYFQASNQPTNSVSVLRKGTIVYIKGGAGVGYIYLAGYYQE